MKKAICATLMSIILYSCGTSSGPTWPLKRYDMFSREENKLYMKEQYLEITTDRGIRIPALHVSYDFDNDGFLETEAHFKVITIRLIRPNQSYKIFTVDTSEYAFSVIIDYNKNGIGNIEYYDNDNNRTLEEVVEIEPIQEIITKNYSPK